MSIPTAERRQFKVGKYDVVARPIPGSGHMLRYTVLLRGKPIGSFASVPTESDCHFLEHPPVLPPLKPYQVFCRRGKKKPPTAPSN
jgi:hypothetical protein